MTHPPIIKHTIKCKNTKTKEYITYQYKDCVKDEDGWIDANAYWPEYYDMCELKTDTGFICRGWKTPGEWFSRMLRPNEKVVKWRKRYELY